MSSLWSTISVSNFCFIVYFFPLGEKKQTATASWLVEGKSRWRILSRPPCRLLLGELSARSELNWHRMEPIVGRRGRGVREGEGLFGVHNRKDKYFIKWAAEVRPGCHCPSDWHHLSDQALLGRHSGRFFIGTLTTQTTTSSVSFDLWKLRSLANSSPKSTT